MAVKNLVTKTTIQNLTAELKDTFAKKSHLPTKVSDLQNDSNFQTETQVDNKISAALVGALKPSGSVTFAKLPAPAAGTLNNLYNVEDAFTTTADFVEGAGKSYPAGTNVAIINAGTDDTPSYKYDAYTGTFDFSGFANKVSGATDGNLASLDANGDLQDSGKKASDFADADHTHNDKADKVVAATSGNLAGLDATGNLTDSGVSASSLLAEGDISDYTAAEIAALLADD